MLISTFNQYFYCFPECEKNKAELQNEAYFTIYHLNMQVSMGKDWNMSEKEDLIMYYISEVLSAHSSIVSSYSVSHLFLDLNFSPLHMKQLSNL